jgi:hypothetical protein
MIRKTISLAAVCLLALALTERAGAQQPPQPSQPPPQPKDPFQFPPQPGQPGQPGQPKDPFQFPPMPGQPGQPGQPGNPFQFPPMPGQPGQPGQPPFGFPPMPGQPLPPNFRMPDGKALQQILTDLRAARDLIAKVPDAQKRKQLQQLMDSIELNARRLALVPDGGGEPFPPFPMPQAIADKDFDALVKAMKAKAFANEKLQTLALSATSAFFTSEQAKTLTKLFPGGGAAQQQKHAVLLLATRVIDPQNFHIVIDAMTFPADRQDVMRRLGIKK